MSDGDEGYGEKNGEVMGSQRKPPEKVTFEPEERVNSMDIYTWIDCLSVCPSVHLFIHPLSHPLVGKAFHQTLRS